MTKKIDQIIEDVENSLRPFYLEREKITLINQEKVLAAMQEEKLQAGDFHWTTGYGYGDDGRDKLEAIYSRVFTTEDALVRPNIVSGTHAIFLCLEALLRPKDQLLSLCGPLYDTMQKAIGLTGEEALNLKSRGILYDEVPLKDGQMDPEAFKNYINEDTKIAMIQRSTGYSNRRAFTIKEIQEAIAEVRKINPSIYIFVDNCYGEFTEVKEPTQVGADIMAGSLIKNPGGGLAYSGGYIVGREDLVHQVANQLTAPGIGKECGLSFGMTRQLAQGLFIAPHVVSEAMKGALAFAKVFESLGYTCIPSSQDPRSDIIQSIRLEDPEKLEVFCQAIQAASPVDAHFTPMPWDMPGYEDQVIMAAGGFIEGSSIELSADGPMRDPYFVYFQGGLTYAHCILSLKKVLEEFANKDFI